jgi:hypothetical protein
MLYCKRVWWAGVIFFIVLLTPATGLCDLARDPYLRRTLLAYLDLEYQRDSFEQGSVKNTYSAFIQTYSLLFRGNLLSRRLIIYDLGVTFSDTQISRNNQNNKTSNDYKDLDFTARTTLLPLSAIPLTLYAERRNLYSDSQKSTQTTYGLNWMAKLRTLPMTDVNVRRSDFVSSSSENVDTDATVTLLKKWGPTVNDLSYQFSQSDDKTHDLTRTRNAVNFDNRTAVSRSTDFFISGTRAIEDATGTSESRLSGLNLGLNSKTSRDVNQVHRYNYYSNSTAGLDQKGQIYSGIVNFVPSTAFRSKLELDATNYVAETPVNKNTQNNLDAAFSMSYHITKRLLLDANASDSTSDVKLQRTGSPTIDSKGMVNRTNDSLTYLITDRLYAQEAVSYNDLQAKFDGQQLMRYTLTTELTNLGYRDTYKKWLKYWAAFGVGFAEEKLNDQKNNGAIDNIDVGFTATPDISEYVGTKAEIIYKRVNKLSQGLLVDSKNQHYLFEVHNKYLKKYALVTLSYERAKVSSLWLNTLAAPLLVSSVIAPSNPINVTTPRVAANNTFDQSTESYKAVMTSTYLRGSSISASVEHRNTFNPIIGDERSDIAYFLATYARPLWKGTLQGTANYNSFSSTTSSGSSSRNYDALLNVNYSRELLRDLGWRGMVQYENKRDNLIKSESYQVQNTLNYNLREWFFTASHTYTLTNALGTTSTDNALLFRVSRAFLRYL